MLDLPAGKYICSHLGTMGENVSELHAVCLRPSSPDGAFDWLASFLKAHDFDYEV